MNVPALIGLSRVIRDPRLCLPHASIPTFAELPVPLSKAFDNFPGGDAGKVDIRAVVLDKDNCFAKPGEERAWPGYAEKLTALKKAYPSTLLIVSNTSGLTTQDPDLTSARTLAQNTGIPVLTHSTRKPSPAVGDAILAHFRHGDKGSRVESAAQIAVVGDRVFTDVVMANGMGAWSVWVREGVVVNRGIVTRIEYGVVDWLVRRGHKPRPP